MEIPDSHRASTPLQPSITSLSSNWRSLQKTLRNSSTCGEDKPSNGKRSRDCVDDTFKGRPTKKFKAVAKKEANVPRNKKMSSRTMSPRTRSSSAPSMPTAGLFSSLIRTPENSRPSTSHKNGTSNEGFAQDRVNEGCSPLAVGGKYVALDCEMVGVGPPPHDISQLARVSVVNYHGEQIYDSFVLPILPVTDYRTLVSGMTPAMLREGRPFSEIQADIATILRGRVLVGHGLSNDLAVLVLRHPRNALRDTSYHKPFRERYSAGGTPSLQLLAREVLGLDDFQNGSHSSVEDARVAMLLFRQDKDNFEKKSLQEPKRSVAWTEMGASQHRHSLIIQPKGFVPQRSRTKKKKKGRKR